MPMGLAFPFSIMRSSKLSAGVRTSDRCKQKGKIMTPSWKTEEIKGLIIHEKNKADPREMAQKEGVEINSE